MTKHIRVLLATAGSCAVLAACGGGGSSSSTNTTSVITPTSSSTPAVPTFQANSFPASSSLKSVCAIVRTDRDLNDNLRDDIQGELAHELFWLRSFMNETYLFFDQVPDRNPNDFTDRQAYFDELLTTQVTASGRLVDRFSFTQDTATREAINSGAPTFGYGASFAVTQSTTPRDWRVRFTQEGSNAETSGFTRGARILTIDGADFVNGTSDADIDALNDGLFPTSIGEDHVFGVRFPDGTETDITVSSQSITIEPVNAVEILQNGDDSVGYLHYTSFSPFTGEEQLFNAFTEFSNAGIDDLVLDFRYNGGGLLDIASQIGYMVAGDEVEGQVFEQLQFNSRAPNVNPFTGQPAERFVFPDQTTGFLEEFPGGQNLPSVDLPRVFVLTTSQSCSASEVVINSLMGVGIEVIQIGSRTCGKPTGQFPVDNCGLTYVPLHFRGVNAQGFGDYDDGFAPGEMTGSAGPVIPGCQVEDDFSALLGSPDEAMLSAALTFASTGSCPSPAITATIAGRDVNGPLLTKGSGFGGIDPLMETPQMKSFLAQRSQILGREFATGEDE